MNRQQANQNLALVLNYLTTFQPESFYTVDITPHEAILHFFDLDKTHEEVYELSVKLNSLRIVGSELELRRNEKLDQTTFDIYWPYGY